MKREYTINNLDCAHCAATIEDKINKMPGVKKASLTFTTKKLKVEAKDDDEIDEKLQDVVSSVEHDATITRLMGTGQYEGAEEKENKTELIQIITGTVLFIAGFIFRSLLPDVPAVSAVIFVAAYLVLGMKVIMKAVRNIGKGQVFDENFLMSVATIAAICIGDFAEAAGVMLFYRIGELFEDIAVNKSRKQIMDAVDLRPETVILQKGEETVEVPSESVAIGDVMIVRPGNRIPLDGTVIDGESRIDTSPVTGEPVPVAVAPGSQLYSGCINEQGVLKMRADARLEDSMVSRILNSVENAAASKPKMDRFITRFARIYTPIVVLVAVLTAIVPSLITGNWSHWIYTAITFLVISCPCALVLSVPLAFFAGIGSASKRGILFKGGLAIEGLTQVKSVVMDKTGTITEGSFKVKEIRQLTRLTEKQLLTIAADAEMNSTHPIAGSILSEARSRRLTLKAPGQVEELSGHGIRAQFPEGEVLVGNLKLMTDNGIDISKADTEITGSVVFIAVAGILQGWIVIDDTIKEDARQAVQEMQELGLHTAIFTGDGLAAAKEVGAEVGVNQVVAKMLPEDKLDRLKEVREKTGSVLFVGDGINDAPVLAGADVGAAMGSGADAAIEAADVVFMNSSVSSIPMSVRIARATNKIAVQNVVFALALKALIILLGFLGYANMWLAVFADTGVAMLCVLNSIRVLRKRF